MAHLDVVPVEGHLAAPAVRRPRSPTAASGAAARSTTRAASPPSARRSRPCSSDGHARPRTSGSPSAATRRCPARPRRSPSTSWSAAASGRGSSSTRAARSPHEAFPGVAAPVGVIGVTEKGVTVGRAPGRGPRRSRLDPGPDGTDRPAGPRDHPDRPVADAGRLPDADRRAVAPAGARTHRSPCGRSSANADRLRPVLTRALIAAGPESAAMARTTFAITTLVGQPGAQRDRLDRHAPASTSG